MKKIITPNKEEGNMENVHITDKESSVKDNVKNKNRNKYSSSLVQWESDDPRKGGKGYAEKLADENTGNGDTSFKEELVLKKETSSNESCMQMKVTNQEKDVGVSLLETVREKGYDLISKFVKGILYNKKNENSEKILDDGRSTIDGNANEIKNNNNQENDIINEDLNDLSEYDDKDEIRNQGETMQPSNLRNCDDSRAHTYKKSTVKMNRRYKVEPISITNIVLFSILFGIVGARKLENLSGNEIMKEKPAWADPTMKEKNYEDKLINAFDCLDDTLPSTQISLKPPKHCEVNDGSAYESAKRKKAQILERVDLIPINITTCVVQFYVNVGWCGGEFAFENFMHQDLQTLRSQIIVPELDCMQAELDGTIKLSTPE